MDTQHCPPLPCGYDQSSQSHREVGGDTSSTSCNRTSTNQQRKQMKHERRRKRSSPSVSPSPSLTFPGRYTGTSSSVCQRAGWCGVDNSTVFMAYSVAKGCTAAALLRLIDERRLDWADPIDQIWPGLACRSVSGVSIAEAASHRLGLPGTPLPPMRFYRKYCAGGWRGLWDEGIAWAEETPTIWQPGSRASYCHLGWSFVVGGMVERKCGEHVADTVQRMAASIGVPHCLHIGRLPPRLWHKTATLEAAPAGHNSVWKTALGQKLNLGWRLLGTIESFLFRRVGNSDLWRDSCFPSSNGFFTAHALARVYGALANKGVVYLNAHTNAGHSSSKSKINSTAPTRLVRLL